jgi:hypothetical protein
MKRSEMLKIIEDAIYQSDFQGYEDYYMDRAAESVLDSIEKVGMIPPSFYSEITFYNPEKSTSGFNKNEWEPEE